MKKNKTNKENKENNFILSIISILILAVPHRAMAQYAWDMASVEAFIDDHKTERSVLQVRSIVEEGNKVLHSNSDKTNAKYKDMEVELDKYTKAFDAIDLVFNAVSTGFNVYKTVDNVSDKIGKYKSLLSDFNNKIIKRGKMEPTDMLLMTINSNAIDEIAVECESIYGSLTAIAAYSSGKMLATTNTINIQVASIDESLTRINRIINRAYFETLTYIRSRTRMWNRAIFVEKTKQTICNEAFGRWRAKSKEKEIP